MPCRCCRGSGQVDEDWPVIEIRLFHPEPWYASAWINGERIRTVRWNTEFAALADVGIGRSSGHSLYRSRFPQGYRLQVCRSAETAAGATTRSAAGAD